MIVIKTDMKEMPKGCRYRGNDCPYLYDLEVGCWVCGATPKCETVFGDEDIIPKNRPSECPLIEVKE